MAGIVSQGPRRLVFVRRRAVTAMRVVREAAHRVDHIRYPAGQRSGTPNEALVRRTGQVSGVRERTDRAGAQIDGTVQVGIQRLGRGQSISPLHEGRSVDGDPIQSGVSVNVEQQRPRARDSRAIRHRAEFRSHRKLRDVGEIVEIEPRVHGDGVVLRRLQHLAIGIQLDPVQVIDDKVRHPAVIRYEFTLERYGDLEGVRILVDGASVGGTEWAGSLTIGHVRRSLAPTVGGGDDEIGGMCRIGRTRELDEDVALIYESGEGRRYEAGT
jgi:hypothetical protein